MAANYGRVSANALTLPWTSSITYQNVGTGPATISMAFRQEGSVTPVPYTAATLAAGAGTSLVVGSVSGLNTAKNSAIISSNQPLVATVVQLAAGVKNRLMSNGLQTADASSKYLIATALKNQFGSTTVFSIQNTEAFDIDAKVDFISAADGKVSSTKTYTILAQSSKYIAMDDATLTGVTAASFNGSAVITANKKGTPATAANIVASANEYASDARNVAGAFEGVPLSAASSKVYMATGVCNYFGLKTAYAIQNAGTTDATVTVTYANLDGTTKTTDGPYTIKAGQKQSVQTCSPNSGANMTGFTGSATIAATSPTAKIVALGKAGAFNPADANYNEVYTIFNGQVSGGAKLAFPYVRWANDANYATGSKQRANLAIQNLGTTTATVTVSYYGKSGGAALGTQTLTIKPGAKGNSNPSSANALSNGEFGYYSDGTFGGGVIVTSTPGANLIGVVRVQAVGTGEDYNGQIVP